MKCRLTTLNILASVILLAGCSSVGDMFKEDAPPLEGERISVLELQKTLEPDNIDLEKQGLLAPAPWKNAFWPQAGGYPNHSMQNLDLNSEQLKRQWSSDIGDGSTDELPLTAQPVLVDGLIFALDTDSRLSAFSAENGDRVWSTDVSNPDEDDPVIGGGISYAAGILYITNGFAEVLAVRPPSGEILWRKTTPAPSRAAPTIMDGRLFVPTIDNRLLALNASNGNTLWEYQGISESAGLVGAASPAANRDIVVPVFSSGDIVALRVENGSVAWTDNLSNLRSRGGLASISDIKAMPVIDKGLIFAMSFSGKIAAIEERTGTRIWQREIGGANTPWLAGNHLFVLSSDNQLVALGRENGTIRWVTELEKFDGSDPIFYAGPLMAGGRLILISTEGKVIEVNPETGDVTTTWDSGQSVNIAPIIAGGTMYVLSENGTLSAYR